MTVYAELVAKLPVKTRLMNQVSIPKRLSLPELNSKLAELEQLCAQLGKTIPLKLKIFEESPQGLTMLFSNEWKMKVGNATNILVLINFALNQYYPDTPEDQKKELTDKIEQAMQVKETPNFQVEKQKKEQQAEKKERNILDLMKPKMPEAEKEGTVSRVAATQAKESISWKKTVCYLLVYLCVLCVSVSFAVGTALFIVTDPSVKTTYTTNQPVAQAAVTSDNSVSLPFTIHEEGKEEQQPIALTSYMKVDKLAAVKGTAVPNKTLVFKDSAGKELGKTKTNDKGVFSVELIEGESGK